jgi:hypothetical protein
MSGKLSVMAVIAALVVAGCASTSAIPDFAQNMRNRFVGKNVDSMVSAFGPPTTSFKMTSGDTAYQWQLASVPSENTYTGVGLACKMNAIASGNGIVTQLTTEDAANALTGQSLCAMKLGL